MHKSSRTLALIFMAVAAITLGSTLVIYWMGQQVNATNQAVIRSRNLVAVLEDTLSILKSAETGQRGYLLTGEEQYLEPYQAALDRIPQHVAELKRAASAGEVSAEQTAIVVRLSEKKLVELAQAIRLRQEKGPEAALATMQTGAGKRVMDELSERIGQMKTQAAAELIANRQRRDRANTLRTVVAGGMALITLLFLGWAYRRIREGILATERAVEALRRYELLASHSRDIILFLRREDGRILEANTAAVDAYGYSREEMLTLTICDIRAAETQDQLAELMAKADDHGILFETVHRRKDGSTFPAEVSSRGATISGLRTLISVIRDITERKAAERTLRESREDLNRAQAVAHTGSWRLAVQRNELLWSDETYRLFGIPLGTPLTYEAFLAVVHPEDRDAVDRKWQAALHGEPYDIEHRIVVDGAVKWVRERAEVEFDSQGVLLGGFGTVQDITAQKQAEAALIAANRDAEQAKAAAEEANQAKDHFLAVLSHELRTPLTPVMTALSMLQADSRCDADVRETLEMVRRNVELESRLIDDLLDVTRIARGKVVLDKRPVSVCQIIEQAAQVCLPDIEARRLHFGIEIKDRPHLVYADAGRLQQVFWNLLKNAIKFTPPEGCVGVRGWCQDDTIIVEISDSGIGIEPGVLPRLFNAFEQAERSTTRQFGGLGLGLAISKALVELHGGSIGAHSEGKGKGAIFRVQLPAMPAAEPGEHRPQTTDINRAGSAIKPLPAARPSRILLVEDHGDTARILRRLLMAEGHEVQTAGDVGTALTLADQGQFDLLISDLGLPDGSGHDLMRELRARGHKLPGIALSGYGQEQDIRRSREVGFAAHLTKPTSPDRLAEAIAAIAANGLPH